MQRLASRAAGKPEATAELPAHLRARDLQALPPRFASWFQSRGWSPRRHQLQMLEKARQGRHALLIAPTGGGKTLAGFLPSLVEISERGPSNHPSGHGLHTLYISPLKALAVDVARRPAAGPGPATGGPRAWRRGSRGSRRSPRS